MCGVNPFPHTLSQCGAKLSTKSNLPLLLYVIQALGLGLESLSLQNVIDRSFFSFNL